MWLSTKNIALLFILFWQKEIKKEKNIFVEKYILSKRFSTF